MATPADTYNYDTFRPGPYVTGSCDGPAPREDLAEAMVHRLDGAPVALGALVKGTTVIEAGSTTCPLYRGNVRRMRAVADAHPEATFVVLYTREAHPGGRRGPHRDQHDKLAVAAELAGEAGEWRDVVVDGLDGALHQRLAGAPNSVLIVDGSATVQAWMHDADAEAVDRALDDLAAGRPPRLHTAFRPPPPHVAVRALRRGGAKAMWEFLLALPALARYRLAGGASC